MPFEPHEVWLRHELPPPRPGEIDTQALKDPAWARRHDQHAVAEEQRLVDVVRDEDHGCRKPRPHVEQQLLHHRRVCASSAPKGSSISSTRGLVDQDPRDLDPLLHPARQLRRDRRFAKASNGRPGQERARSLQALLSRRHPASSGQRQHCRSPASRETACAAETPCPDPDGARSPARRRAVIGRRARADDRPARRAAWTFRSRRDRGCRRTRPARSRHRDR